jgi:hypothetical protein
VFKDLRLYLFGTLVQLYYVVPGYRSDLSKIRLYSNTLTIEYCVVFGHFALSMILRVLTSTEGFLLQISQSDPQPTTLTTNIEEHVGSFTFQHL